MLGLTSRLCRSRLHEIFRLGDKAFRPLICRRTSKIARAKKTNEGSKILDMFGPLSTESPAFPTEAPKTEGRIISSLVPSSISQSDLLQLSELKHPPISTVAYVNCLDITSQKKYLRSMPDGGPFPIHYWRDDASSSGPTLPFPPNTSGYLYYTTTSDSPATGGQIRLRLAEQDQPFSLVLGADLLLHNGFPWRIPLLMLACPDIHPFLKPLTHQLLADNLVSPDLMSQCAGIRQSSNELMHLGDNISHSFTDPFLLTFNRKYAGFWLIGKDRGRYIRIDNPLRDTRFFRNPQSFPLFPYEGSALVRFEPFSQISSEVYVLRIIELMEEHLPNPTYDEWVHPPEVDELIMVTRSDRLEGRTSEPFQVRLPDSGPVETNVHNTLSLSRSTMGKR